MTTETIINYLQDGGIAAGAGIASSVAAVKIWFGSKFTKQNVQLASVSSTLAATRTQLTTLQTEAIATKERELAKINLNLENKFISEDLRTMLENQKAEIVSNLGAKSITPETSTVSEKLETAVSKLGW